MKDWHEFYLLVGTAAAALIALLFVAASIGAGVMSPERASATRRDLAEFNLGRRTRCASVSAPGLEQTLLWLKRWTVVTMSTSFTKDLGADPVAGASWNSRWGRNLA